MEKEKNIIILMVNQNSKENIKMGKDVDMELNLIRKVLQFLKVNILMEKEMEKEKNMMTKAN